jgi:hypothetical protein
VINHPLWLMVEQGGAWMDENGLLLNLHSRAAR